MAIVRAACASLVLALGASLAAAAPPSSPPSSPPAVRPRGEVTVDALSVVKLRSRAVQGARSSAQLGREREGTGVVIDGKSLVITIGYLILEAETIELSTVDGRTFPARVVGYDAATGFGVVRSLAPLPISPIEFGDSSTVTEKDRVLIVGFDGVAPAYVVSRRRFVGYWEYLLDDAIYTAPVTVNWAGAALIDREGKLVGIGSLAVPDAAGPRSQVPGNLFVPIDRLKPMLANLVAHGRASDRSRPWIGIQTQDVEANVIVTQVRDGSPAEQAPLRVGDVIVAVGGQTIRGQADLYRRIWATGEAGVEIAMDVLRDGRIQRVTVKSIDRDRYYRARPTF